MQTTTSMTTEDYSFTEESAFIEGSTFTKGSALTSKSIITEESILNYRDYLRDNEKSKATIEKYTTSIRKLMIWLDGRGVSHSLLMDYRYFLRSDHAATTVNGAISAINSYLDYVDSPEYKLKLLKVQKKVFRSSDRDLTKEQYNRLVRTAGRLGKTRLLLIIETICSTGIRVSELVYITVESLEIGYAEVTLKGKTRTIFLTQPLVRKLKKYVKEQSITSGAIFLTRNGTPISRKQIWEEMKALSEEAGVPPTCVFPHNLRHLFARCYYEVTHDIARLSDMLGHSSIETTRIYLISTGLEHAQDLEKLDLIS